MTAEELYGDDTPPDEGYELDRDEHSYLTKGRKSGQCLRQ
jgi:hypothetical protein